MPANSPPDFSRLGDALAGSAAAFARVDAVRDGRLSAEGGDVGAHGSSRLVTRHVVNYLAAVDLARRHPAEGAVVDVGSGVGALGVWAASELDAPLCLVDRDQRTLRLASKAFPHVQVEREIEDVAAGCARVITAMEVIEHIVPSAQAAFVRDLMRLLAPGGVLVMSTPDETRYPGGWSGYSPHVGTLSFAELQGLLLRNTSWPVEVWRLEGKPFELGRTRALTESVVNRAWGLAERSAPALTDRAVSAAARLGRRHSSGPHDGGEPASSPDTARLRNDPQLGSQDELPDASGDQGVRIHATVDQDGPGTGLLGVVRRPHA